MTQLSRRVGIGVAFLFLTATLVGCGGATGEGATGQSKATAAPAAPVAQAATPKFLVITGDTVRGKLGLTEEQALLTYPGIHCTQQSRFPQGQRIVWRMKVMDPTTGKYMDDKQIQSFTVTYPDGKSDKFVYGGHGGTKEKPEDYIWAAGYTIPVSYPTGLFAVKIEAKSLEGAVGVFDPIKVSYGMLTIVPKEPGK